MINAKKEASDMIEFKKDTQSEHHYLFQIDFFEEYT